MSQGPRDEPSGIDAGLTRAWRDASRDEPPAALDAAIRAAARKAVHARPRPAGGAPFGGRWRVPLSVAALLVVSATLTLLVAERDKHGSRVLHDQAAPRPAAPAPEAFSVQPAPARPEPSGQPSAQRSVPAPSTNVARERDSTPAAQAAPEERKASAPARPSQPVDAEKPDGRLRAQPAEEAVAPEPAQEAAAAKAYHQEAERAEAQKDQPRSVVTAPAAVPPALRSDDSLRDSAQPPAGEPVAELTKREAQTAAKAKQGVARQAPVAPSTMELQARQAAPQAESRAFPAAPGSAASARAAATPAPEDLEPRAWLERILELRRRGKLEEADKSLKAFRERYPEYPLPSELQPPQ